MVNIDPYPDAPGESGSAANISKLLGVGAYTLDDSTEGSGLNFGQDVGSDTFVKSLIYSIAMGMGPGDGSISSALTNLGTYLGTMPLDSLKLLQPFIPGATDNDFADSVTAVEKIMDQFNIDAMLSITDFNNWVSDIFNPNGAFWQEAKENWDVFLAGMGIGDPDLVAEVIKENKQNWDDFLTEMGLDPTQIAEAIAKATQDWTDFMAAWGIGTPADVAAATAASQAKWNAFLASIGLGSATAAGAQLQGNNTSITTQQAWWARLPENLLISMDQAHWFYPLGSPSDTPTTTSGGKRTWYAMKADMALMQGQTNGTATPTIDIGMDLGTFATTTQTTVVTNQETLAQVQADVDALKTADPTVAGAKFISSATGAVGSWGSLWTVTATNGNIAPLGDHDSFTMTLASSSSIDLKLKGLYTGGVTLTDNQIVSAIFSEEAQYMAGGNGPSNTFKGREDSAGNNYVFVRVRATQVALGYAVGGIEQTPWTTVTTHVPAGAKVELFCGSSAGPRNYQVKVNGVVVLTWAEVGTSSQMGASYRGGGMDQFATHGLANDTWRAARVKQFTLKDSNVASLTYGTSARWTRSSTTGILFPKGVIASVGLSIFDTEEYISPDLTLNTSSIAIHTPGRYRMTFNLKVTSSVVTPWTWAAISGTPITSYGALNKTVSPGPVTTAYADYGFNSNSVIGIAGDFSFNSNGDPTTEVWSPALAITGSGNYAIIGDGGGEGTWCTIERIG